jgi:flagellar biosynthesis protein FlhG
VQDRRRLADAPKLNPPSSGADERFPTGAPPAAAHGPPGSSADRAGREDDVIRSILRDIRPRARVYALASGKGGVGKTNLAVNLAIAMAAAGRRVLVVDADMGLANVDLVMGRRARGDLGHVLSGQMSLDAVVQEGPAGIRWIPGASHMPALGQLDEARRERLLEGLAGLEGEHDVLLLDAPAGIGRGVLNLARQADGLILVTTPEPPAMMDAYTTLKAVAAEGADSVGDVGLVVNMVGHRREADRVHRRLSETADRFLGVRVAPLGYVFCDGHVGRAVQRQEPFLLAYPHSQAAWCVKRVAMRVLEGADGPMKPRFGFFRRMANLFSGSLR